MFEYRIIYPKLSAPAEFYRTIKKHKIPVSGTVGDLPFQAIISNIRTASYQLAKYFTKML